MEVECTAGFASDVKDFDVKAFSDWHDKLPADAKVTVDPSQPVIHGMLWLKAVWTEVR